MTDKLTHHHLSAEEVHDEHGKAIMLTQQDDGYNEPNTVLVHPWQLRAVCEQFGIIASDPQAAKTIATLQRRMVALRESLQRGHHCDTPSTRRSSDTGQARRPDMRMQEMGPVPEFIAHVRKVCGRRFR